MKHAIASTALGAIILVGCGSEPPPATLPSRGPSFTVPASRAEATAALVERNMHLSDDIARFPGDSLEEHRTILSATLDDLSKALRLANGPVESPEFTNRILVIDKAQATASIGDLPRARMEAVETQALLAAAAALDEIKTRFLYDDEQLPPMLDGLHADVNKASVTVGPLHDVDATHGFRSAETVVQRMADDMTQRFGGGAPPAGAASTPPPPPPPPGQ